MTNAFLRLAASLSLAILLADCVAEVTTQPVPPIELPPSTGGTLTSAGAPGAGAGGNGSAATPGASGGTSGAAGSTGLFGAGTGGGAGTPGAPAGAGAGALAGAGAGATSGSGGGTAFGGAAGTPVAAGGASGGAAGMATFAVVGPLVARTCGRMMCHGGMQMPSLRNMTPTTLHRTLTTRMVSECGNVPLVAPGNPTGSAFLRLVTGQCTDDMGEEFRMPRDCEAAPCIAEADIATMTAWIQAGAAGP